MRTEHDSPSLLRGFTTEDNTFYNILNILFHLAILAKIFIRYMAEKSLLYFLFWRLHQTLHIKCKNTITCS